MALPGSPNSISMSQVNVEIGQSMGATISMNDLFCRSLAGNGTTVGSGASWSLGNIRGYSFYKYQRSNPITYWSYVDTGGLTLYYEGGYKYGGGGNPASLTTGGYTYYRGALASSQYTATGESGGYTTYYYTMARA